MNALSSVNLKDGYYYGTWIGSTITLSASSDLQIIYETVPVDKFTNEAKFVSVSISGGTITGIFISE